MAYIRRVKNKWKAEVERDGVRKSATWDTQREAKDWAARVEAEIAAGVRVAIGGKKTLEDACEEYLRTVSVTKRNAVDFESKRFFYFKQHFGPVTLSSITSKMIGEWRDKRLETVSGSTVLREVNLFRNLFKIAVREWKWIRENPFDGVRLPKESDPRNAIWRWQEIKRVLREGEMMGGKSGDVVTAFHIALRTGMRLQEALAAPAGFDAVRRVVVLPATKTAPRGETVPLTRQGYRLLSKCKPPSVGSNEASTLFSKLLGRLGIKGLEFRDSRATALTLMTRKMDILTLIRISRHRDARMVAAVYYRESSEDISRRL